jgi:hypothetical protein
MNWKAVALELKNRCMRAITIVNLQRPSVREYWSYRFKFEPELCAARDFVNQGHVVLGLQTMAGYYNDHVKYGHMSLVQVAKLYDNIIITEN